MAIKMTEKKELDFAPRFYIVGYRDKTSDYCIGRSQEKIKIYMLEFLINEGKIFVQDIEEEYRALYGFIVKEEEGGEVAQFAINMTDLTAPQELSEEDMHSYFQRVLIDLENFWISEGGFSEEDFITDDLATVEDLIDGE